MTSLAIFYFLIRTSLIVDEEEEKSTKCNLLDFLKERSWSWMKTRIPLDVIVDFLRMSLIMDEDENSIRCNRGLSKYVFWSWMKRKTRIPSDVIAEIVRTSSRWRCEEFNNTWTFLRTSFGGDLKTQDENSIRCKPRVVFRACILWT